MLIQIIAPTAGSTIDCPFDPASSPLPVTLFLVLPLPGAGFQLTQHFISLRQVPGPASVSLYSPGKSSTCC